MLENKTGEIILENFEFDKYSKVLENTISNGEKIYNDAYISCANKAFGYDRKHNNHLALLQKMFILTLEISVPILLVGVILGLLVSIFQTVTQIQESTLTFVPKIIGCVLLLIFLMPWIIGVFITTVNEFMSMIPQLIGGA